MKKSLFLAYARAGLIQFGNFEANAPVGFYFSLLPSFPDLLQSTAELLAPMLVVQRPSECLVTTRRTTALGGVVATLTGMPMLYPLGDQLSYTPAFAIEGTADVGNPLTLLTDVLTDGIEEDLLITNTRRIGLPIKRVVAIVDTKKSELQVDSLFVLGECLEWLHEANLSTSAMIDAVRAWLA